jgi:RHH-type proline utilization regulon transcriptional repressor/proline dehydrogenase/delta 1-pyrroline-5-carboxylate dehydrogenase
VDATEASVTREARIQALARRILGAAREDEPSLLSPERWQGEMMGWVMADEHLKVEMLRFVDVFPTLRSRREVSRHLREYFARQGVEVPKVLRWGISLSGEHSPVAPLANSVIKRQMKGFAQRFIVGRTRSSPKRRYSALWSPF